MGGGHGLGVLGGLGCQTQKEQQSQGQEQEPSLDDGMSLLYSSPVSGCKRLLPCLFVPQG